MSMNIATYFIGELDDSDDMRAVDGDLEAAKQAALDATEESDEAIIGVWSGDDNTGYDLLAIATLGELFVRATS